MIHRDSRNISGRSIGSGAGVAHGDIYRIRHQHTVEANGWQCFGGGTGICRGCGALMLCEVPEYTRPCVVLSIG